MKILTFLRTNMMLAAAFLTAGITMSFNMAENKKADTIYTFNTSDLLEGSFAKTANWMAVSSTPGCLTSGNRPGNIVVPSGSSLSSEIGGLTNS